ncbi:hypothetical protein SAY86_028611 [Trapa natans]|uniref:Uncharacterized protein n=1 Tax=Trapa natans TaxID=22666 RepID=A0AAN7MFR4_TRANT|nr:hypothetical protein SAY86_028611 [Trapa natans]
MKGPSCAFVASVVAASTAAFSSSSSSDAGDRSAAYHVLPNPDSGYGSSSQRKFSAMDSSDKFAPRFDGLRFIETLVTAHR